MRTCRRTVVVPAGPRSRAARKVSTTVLSYAIWVTALVEIATAAASRAHTVAWLCYLDSGSDRAACGRCDGSTACTCAPLSASTLLDACESIRAISEWRARSDPAFTLRAYTPPDAVQPRLGPYSAG